MSGSELFVAFTILAAFVALLARRGGVQPTVALLLVGAVCGVAGWTRPIALSADAILLLFLPPLLFEAAFFLPPGEVWARRGGIAALALPGVLLATATTAGVVHLLLGLPPSSALLFGAIVAATDPVAVVATLRALRVERRLAVLLEGESLLNDATALVLVLALTGAATGHGGGVGDTVLAVGGALAGGVLLGAAAGWLAHLLIGLVDDHLTEMAATVGLAYGVFLLARQLHCSAVLAVLTAAVVLGHCGRRRGWVFSGDSQRVLHDLWAFLGFAANAALFLLMGLTVAVTDLPGHAGAVAAGLAGALAGRAAVAYGLGTLLGRWGATLAPRERHVLFWGGLRGAVALAAALALPAELAHRGDLLAMTYGVVVASVLVQGATIGRLLRRLGYRPFDGQAGHAPVGPAPAGATPPAPEPAGAAPAGARWRNARPGDDAA